MDEMELRKKRAALIKQARDMLDVLDTEDRDFTAEEKTKYEKIDTDIEGLNDRIEKEARQAQRELELGKIIDSAPRPEPQDTREKKKAEYAEKRAEAFRGMLAATNSGDFTAAVAEARALQMDSPTAGGYTVAPQEFVTTLIKDIDNMSIVRPLASVYSVPKAESLGAPTLATDIEDATWTGEITTRDEDTALAFGKRELRPHPCAKLLKVSKKLIRASALNVEQIVRQRMAYKFGITEENAFLNGTGAEQPLGVFTASDDGISTGQDVSTGNTDTSIMFDGLSECKYKLKAGYWQRAVWVFHRDAMKQIRKLKDGEGQYIWQQSVQTGAPDRILGFPAYMSEYAPSTFTSGNYVGIIGDFSYYWIADALDMSMQVLVELYAATNQNGYIGLKETDGMPVLENAFARVTLA